jgi:hypothetical protein
VNEWAGDLDELPDTDAVKHLQHEFSMWECFRATDRLCYARDREEPGRSACGEDWTDLRDMIIREIGRSEAAQFP